MIPSPSRKGTSCDQKIDPYGKYIPNYHFFCPEPARHDQNLMYRDKLADGDLGPWQEVVTTFPRRWLHMLWSPNHRLDKGMMDVANELVRFALMNGNDMARLSVTRPYLSILNMVTYSVEHDPRAVQTQFAIGHSAAPRSAVCGSGSPTNPTSNPRSGSSPTSTPCPRRSFGGRRRNAPPDVTSRAEQRQARHPSHWRS